MSAIMVLLRDKLGPYKAMAKAGPATSAELHRQRKRSNGMFVSGWAIRQQGICDL
jgi:hypothetical protein